MSFVDWQAGMRITASRLRDITPELQTWSPTWATSTGANTPSFGNATVVAEYMEFGRLCIGRLEITFGSTTNFGGGGTGDNWRFSLPVTAASSVQAAGFGEAQDTSVSGTLGRVGLRARITLTTTLECEITTGRPDSVAITNGNLVDAVSPWTWANTDAIRVFFQYPTAS